MRHPETGLVTPYEELWRRLPLTEDGSEPRICFLETVSQAGGSGADQTFVGRVGDHQIGLQCRDGLVSVLARHWRGSQAEVVAAVGNDEVLRPALESLLGAMTSGGRVSSTEGWRVIEQS